MKRAPFLFALAASSAVPILGPAPATAKADATLTIEEANWEVRPGLTVRTKTYGGKIPGPLLRFREGERVTIAVRNTTSETQTVHWHGLIVSDLVDGVVDTGTPPVRPHTARSYTFVVTPGGTRWYHSHFGEGLFSGMFGPLIIDRNNEPGNYDREVILLLHEFKHSIPAAGMMMERRPPGSPTLSAPAMDMGAMMGGSGSGMMGGGMMSGGNMMGGGMMGPNMLMHDATYAAYAINGKALGAGDPIRVKRGERVRFRIINASATKTHRMALPRHRFQIIELDGNPVPNPHVLDAIELGPAERVDAIVTMDQPGIWIFGSTQAEARAKGMGIVVAYDGEVGAPVWQNGAKDPFRYQVFAAAASHPDVDHTIKLALRKSPAGPDAWSINGRRYPNTIPIRIREGHSYLLQFFNMSMMEHPMHTHGHIFELVRVDGQAIAGVLKDTVLVRPMMGRTDVLLRANNPYRGRFLLHCHNQQHMDGGMMTVLTYE
jgi:FtsP/CotA-like multicopper oxidase with cupredoxin domain